MAWFVLYYEIFITLWYFHIWFTPHFHQNQNLKTRVRNLLVFHFKTLCGVYFPEWDSILWFIKIRGEHKGTNFQHLELLGVTFNLGLKQTKSTALFRLLWLNDDGRRNVARDKRRVAILHFYCRHSVFKLQNCHGGLYKTNFMHIKGQKCAGSWKLWRNLSLFLSMWHQLQLDDWTEGHIGILVLFIIIIRLQIWWTTVFGRNCITWQPLLFHQLLVRSMPNSPVAS